eukprot:CAMPEP_0118649550 /NCGR_PEP_ID=MMETSP0785-20121206/9764_1 /TAXON_ID=91992 /ORGANISM="Bolidomonas pacifica, Strain CCMP 1866" /LENGTH=490 /DNA_ID=CAMNT_0006541847 /DNA_START=142 /DNA_END=1611 /DNA_ORIENTATION=-
MPLEKARVRISPGPASRQITSATLRNSESSLMSKVLKANKGLKDRRRRRKSIAMNNEHRLEGLYDSNLPKQFKSMTKLCVALGIGVEERKTASGQILFYSFYITALMLCAFLFDQSRRLGNISAVFQWAFYLIVVIFVYSYWACRSKLLVENCFVKERMKTKEILRISKREDLEELVDKGLKRFKPPWKFALLLHPVIWLHAFSNRTTILEPLTVSILVQLLHLPCHVFWNGFRYISFLHTLQIDAFRDALCVAFHDLANAKTEERIREEGKTLDSDVESGQSSVANLPEMTKFFHEEWILDMTIKFVQIRDTLGKTSLHFGRDSAVIICLLLGSVGLVGLTMLVDEKQITIENTIVAIFIFYLLVELVSFPIKANSSLSRTREVAWECYGELNAYTLLGHQDGWSELDIIKYKQTVNAAKHLLNLVQTNREGIKFLGNVEVSVGLILKLLSIVLSCTVVIFRTGDLTNFTWNEGAMAMTIDHNITSNAG